MKTETLFHTYAQFATVPDIPPKPSDDERQTEVKLQDILEKVRGSPIALPDAHKF
jgi:Golgi SNAP receptor complex protein 1